MMNYNEILDIIRNCEGKIVTIIKDFERLNSTVLSSIKNSLSSDYIILDLDYSYDNILDIINNTTDKTILFVNSCDDRVNRELNNINDNLIIIYIKRYYKMFNTSIFTNDSVVFYMSTAIFLFKNKKIELLKSRYSSVDDKFMEMTVFSRKIKLQSLKKISDQL